MPMNEYFFIVAAAVSFANGLALLLVNPRRLINRIFFGGTILTCIWFFCIVMTIRTGYSASPYTPNGTLLFWLRMSSAVPAFIVSQLAVMRIQLEEEITSFTQLLKKTWGWNVMSCFMAALAFSDLFISASSTPSQRERGPAYLLFMALAGAFAIWAIVHFLIRTPRLAGIRKLETQFFVFNSSAASLLVLACSLGATAFPGEAWLRRLGPVWVCLWQALTVWSVCHHRIFDARHVVLSVGQRVLLFGALGAVAVGLASILDGILGLWPGVLLASVTACGLAIHCDRPMRIWFGLDPEHRLAPLRNTIIDYAKRSPGEEKLHLQFEALLREWCQTDLAALLPQRGARYENSNTNLSLRDDWRGLMLLSRDGWTTPESLQRKKETSGAKECSEFMSRHEAGALLAVPKGSATPSLVIALGSRHSLRPYTYPDIQLLLDLAELMDNILTHSRIAARTAQIEKMEAAAIMSRGLAHDLNNLATPVSSFLLHMETRVTAGTVEAEVLADAKHSIRVMQDYIRESLFFARRLVPDFQPVSSVELVDATIRVTQTRAQIRGVDVVLGKTTADLTFKADRALIQRLLQNLVFNGIDSTPRGGQVTLSATTDAQDRICFTVADQGPGVPAGIMNHIFEPYFTTKDTGDDVRGLGLGLAICKKIGDLHQGTLGVGRARSGGAVFKVSLPANPKPPSSLSVAAARTPAPQQSPLAAGPDTDSILPR